MTRLSLGLTNASLEKCEKTNPLPHQPIKMEIFRELTNATGFSYRDF